MAWTDLSGAFGYGTKLTSQQMQQLRDNIAAMANGDSGAPEIQEAAYGSSTVDQTALKDSTGDQSGSVSDGGTVIVTMNDFCFSPNIYGQATSMTLRVGNSNSGTVGRFRIYNPEGTSQNYEVNWRYITATGEPFIFVLQDPVTGDIKHVWMSEDDPPPKFPDVDPIIEIDKNGQQINFIKAFEEKADVQMIKDLRAKGIKDLKLIHEIMQSDYEFDSQANIFKPKNLITV
jgi:hypothetical protein